MTKIRPTLTSAASTGLLLGVIAGCYEKLSELPSLQTSAWGEAVWILAVVFTFALVSLFVIGIQEPFKRRSVQDQSQTNRRDHEITKRMLVWILAAGLSMVVVQPLLSLALRLVG